MRGKKKTPVPEGVHPEEIIRLLGYDISELRSPSVERRLADQRRVVAYVLRSLGMIERHIGDALNRKRISVVAMLRTSYLVGNETAKAMELIEKLGYGKEEKEELQH